MLCSSAGSNPAGRRTVAAPSISSIGGRVVVDTGTRDLGFIATGPGAMVTGSIVARAVPAWPRCRGSHLRMTLALMRWLRAMAETDAPGAKHWATTSRLNCSE